MRFHCVELGWDFDSVRLAWTLVGCGLTVIERCVEIVGFYG